MIPEGRRSATEAEARALASALRLRILRLCLDQALTNKEIAQRLEANPATILHHVRTLVATGFLAAEEERRGTRGAREVPYRATGKSWGLDTGPRWIGGAQAMLDAFLQELRDTDIDDAKVSRLGLRLSREEFEEFNDRLAHLFDEYARRPSTVDGRAYSVFFAMHADPRREELPTAPTATPPTRRQDGNPSPR